jgi:dipeptidyl aminopeptidase/acylaminoacyl peptidase
VNPDDIFLWRAPGTPAVLPDGTAAVVAVGRPDAQDDDYRSGLWWVPLDGGTPRVLTRGHTDTAPVVSPDGRWVAFVRRSAGARPQVHLVEAAGGEPFAVTAEPAGASEPQFSPDGSRIAYLARLADEGRYVAEGDARSEAPRLITTLRYREDGLGYSRDRHRRLFVVAVPDVAPGQEPVAPVPGVPLTPVALDVSSPRWFPTGEAVAVVAARHADREGDLRRDALVVHVPGVGVTPPADPADPLPLTDADAGSTLAVDVALPAADGHRVWLLARDTGPSGRDFVAALTGVYVLDHVLDADGTTGAGTPRRLTDVDEVDLEGVLVEHDAGVLVAEQRTGAVSLVHVRADGTSRTLLDGELVVLGAGVGGGRVVVARATPDSAGDLVELADPQRTLTDLSADLRAAGRLRVPAPLTAHAPDCYRVEGWLTLPDAAVHGPGPYPTVLKIHGGPFAQYTHALFDEVQVLATAGYAVVHGNPRGSSGRGRAHGRAIRRAFGTVDTDDVLALLDEALTDTRLDATRTGVMGGSYGGYLAAWLTTRTQRFTAAIVERGFLDPVSFLGSSDIGWFFGLEYLGDASDEPELVAAQSPMAHVASVRTPTLVIHSEEDWRCPVEQGQRWFVELKRRGVPTELLLFPGEGHELSRSGRPSHRVARFEHVLRWWRTYLPVTSEATTG